ncbi:hypothetical protein ACFL2Y_04275 [Candidatus Omnitrophota bacterium]
MKKIVCFLIIAIATLFFLELILRILSVFPSNSALVANDPVTGYRMRPGISINNFTVNSHGFMDVKRTHNKQDGYTRIAFIGDSFVIGLVPFEKNFTSVIKNFADRSAIKTEVLNTGIIGADPRMYSALINNYATSMNVDIVCVVFYVGNDITQSHPDFKSSSLFGTVMQNLRKPYLIGFSKEYCYVYRALRALNRYVRHRYFDKSHEGMYSPETFLSIKYRRLVNFKIKKNSFMRTCYKEAIKNLLLMAQDARNNNMEFFVVLAPDELQVNADLRTALEKKYRIKTHEYDFDQPQDIIAKQLKRNGIKVLNLLPVLKGRSSSDSLYIKNDTHWNEEGNYVVAEHIWPFIITHFFE